MDAPNITGYYTLRRDYTRIADEWNKKRLELVALQREMSETITRLVEAGERIFTKGLGELDANGELKKEFGGPLKKAEPETNVEAVADHVNPGRRKPTEEVEINDEGTPVVKGKRACSLCRQPGHWAKNCPNAHKVREQQQAEVAARGGKRKKRTMKPLSPERRAQLAKTLEKARAARKGGKK